MAFGLTLKNLREQNTPFNQEEFGVKVGVSGVYIGQIEKERRFPEAELFEKIIDVLKNYVSTEQLDNLKTLAAEEKLSNPKLKPFYDIVKGSHIDVPEFSIPIVSRAGATDDIGRTCFEPYDPPYDRIDFKNCRAVTIDSDSMSPVAYRGQKIIYSITEEVHNGDLAFIKMKDGSQLFKRYFKSPKNGMVTLQSINPSIHYAPIVTEMDEIDELYKVVGVEF
ncbi:MAG: LexA family transcriptional regulator [Candidatus Auribacterota bacterium]